MLFNLLIIFVALKLVHAIAWSWWWVCLPGILIVGEFVAELLIYILLRVDIDD